MAKERFEISNGPGKFELMVSLLHGELDNRSSVQFHSEKSFKSPMRVRINSLEREDGSGDCWNLTGFALGYAAHEGKVQGFFRTDSRKGWIEFVK